MLNFYNNFHIFFLILHIGQSKQRKSVPDFLNRQTYLPLTSFLEPSKTIFTEILYQHHKKSAPTPVFSNFNALFDQLGWNSNISERKELIAYGGRLVAEYDRFCNGNNVKFISGGTMPEILKNLRLGVKEVEVEEIKWGKFNGLAEFLKFYQGKYCKNLVSKVLLDFEFQKKYGFSLISKKPSKKDFFLEEFDENLTKFC